MKNSQTFTQIRKITFFQNSDQFKLFAIVWAIKSQTISQKFAFFEACLTFQFVILNWSEKVKILDRDCDQQRLKFKMRHVYIECSSVIVY